MTTTVTDCSQRLGWCTGNRNIGGYRSGPKGRDEPNEEDDRTYPPIGHLLFLGEQGSQPYVHRTRTIRALTVRTVSCSAVRGI